MKAHPILYVTPIIILTSCNFSRSVHKDLTTGMVTRGNGLSCQETELFAGNEKAAGNTFSYGERIRVEFNGIEGFERINEHAFPGMSLTVLENKGDTVLAYGDLYSDLVDGTPGSPLLLKADLVLADPIHSDRDYTLMLDIRDKKGEGSFSARLKFSVVQDELIQIEADRLTWDEIYLYSGRLNRTITDHHAGFHDVVYMIFEGLDGFMVREGTVQLGLSLTVTDSTGRRVIVEEDLLGGDLLDAAEVQDRLAPHFIVSDTGVVNPVSCEVRVWDKNSGRSIRAGCDLRIE